MQECNPFTGRDDRQYNQHPFEWLGLSSQILDLHRRIGSGTVTAADFGLYMKIRSLANSSVLPEFLREAYTEIFFLNPSYIALGSKGGIGLLRSTDLLGCRVYDTTRIANPEARVSESRAYVGLDPLNPDIRTQLKISRAMMRPETRQQRHYHAHEAELMIGLTEDTFIEFIHDGEPESLRHSISHGDYCLYPPNTYHTMVNQRNDYSPHFAIRIPENMSAVRYSRIAAEPPHFNMDFEHGNALNRLATISTSSGDMNLQFGIFDIREHITFSAPQIGLVFNISGLNGFKFEDGGEQGVMMPGDMVFIRTLQHKVRVTPQNGQSSILFISQNIE